jgi:hypothetical protein
MKKLYIVSCAFLISMSLQAQKINLTSQNIVNVSAVADANTLVDEQVQAGNPKSGTSGAPVTAFSNGYQQVAIYYPLEVIIDLYGTYALTDIYFYDSNNSDSLFISSGSIGAWTPLIQTTTSGYNTWRSFPINKSTRYLQLKFKSPATIITEVVLYGSLTGTAVKPVNPTPIAMKFPLMENFIGMNSFHDVPDSLQKVVTQIREYHDWGWDEGNGTAYTGYPNNAYGWNPSWVSGTGWGWNFDDVYTRSLAHGLVMQPDLKQCAPYMFANDNTKGEAKPVRNGKNTELPTSYPEHADYMYQFAARYGKVAKPITTLKLRTDNAPKTGLGLVRYIENWNEQDKNWIDKQSHFSPFEFAAMSSADYDGHLGSMGNTFGMKNADPSIQLVMGGLINIDTLYMKAMIFWAREMRNGSFPVDILNFHHYSNDGGGQGGTQTKGISPEDDHLKDRMMAMVKFRNKNLPGKEVWLSEFGYDSNPGSIQGSPAIGAQNPWETQARWLIRSYLAIAASGADRAHMFMSRDVDGSKTGMFSSSGLLTAPQNDGISTPYTKKNSWYYVYTLRKRLTGYRFKQEIASGNPNVFIYAFERDAHPDSLVYAVWAPTSTDLTVPGYVLQIPNVVTVSKVELTNKDTMGIKSTLVISNQSVKIDVNEKPALYLIKVKPVVTALHENNDKEATVSIYPNPFNNTFAIELGQHSGQVKLTLTDVRGQVLKTEMMQGLSKEMNLSHLSGGTYFLHIALPSGDQVKKIIKY